VSPEIPEIDHPLVSVIIPVGPGVCRQDVPAFWWLQQAIATALGQTAPAEAASRPRENWLQILVALEIGGGNNAELLAGLPVEVVAVSAGALGPARNAAIGFARGDWLAFLDADDRWDPHKTASQLAAVAEAERDPGTGPVSIVYSNARTVNAAGQQLGPGLDWVRPVQGLADLIAANRIPLPTVMIRREVFHRAEGFDPRNRIGAEDYGLWLCVAAAGGRFLYVPESLASYRVHANQLTADGSRTIKGVAIALRLAWLRSLGL
jgi:hypothetical protein